jgi:hypothetical protein
VSDGDEVKAVGCTADKAMGWVLKTFQFMDLKQIGFVPASGRVS